MLFNIRSKVIENIFALATIKGLEYLLAFITFPYLTRVLQVERFGAVVLAQGIIQYFVLFTDYGFNLTGPRAIACSDGTEKLGRSFAAIFAAKLFLLALAGTAFIVGGLLIGAYFNVDFQLYSVWFLMVVGNVIFPIWFFQGIQQMRYITIATIIARACSVAGIFLLVRSPEDYLLAAGFQAAVPLVAGLCAWTVILRYFPQVCCLPKLAEVRQQLIDGWQIFISTIAINLYTASNVVFLGALTNTVTVGYFSGAKKIIDNVTAIFSPISQAVYPHICRLAEEAPAKASIFIKKMLLIMGGGNFLLSLFLLIGAEFVVRLLLGEGYEESVAMLRIMAFLPFIVALSNVFGIQALLPLGMQREFSRILLSAAVFNTIIILPAIYFWQGRGVCCSVVLAELFVTCSMGYVLHRKKVLY